MRVGRPYDRATLADLVGECAGREIWIVGDLMLDEYVHGAVERVSPEAPVPVVKAGEPQFRLGGAANVARQVAAIGSRALLAGVVGEDEAGDILLEECARAGIDTRGVVRDRSRRTTRKLRVLGQGQQLVRLDWEESRPCDATVTAQLCERLESLGDPAAVILSDYAKGVLTDGCLARLIDFGAHRKRPVLVDPKRRDFTAYRRATSLTPNLSELSQAAGRRLDPADKATIAATAHGLVSSAELDGMLVTLSDHGMMYVRGDGSYHHVPAVRRDVADVTGAGDTAVAIFAAALAAAATIEQAMELANTAAGLAVAQVGTVAIRPDQLRAALVGEVATKVLDRRALAARAAEWRAAGKTIVFTNGCFDLLHVGHLALLQRAAALGDVLVLAINSDDSVARLKGSGRPIVPASERAALLAALGCVDAVTVFDEDTPHETLRAVRPHILVKGQDYDRADVVGREVVEADGGRVELVPLVDEHSTTAILKRIQLGGGGRLPRLADAAEGVAS